MNPNIASNVSLRHLNSLGFEVTAEQFARAQTLPQLQALLAQADQQGWPVLLLGGGSNLILSAQVPGLVVQLANRGIQLLETTDDSVTVEVAAGENWHDWVQHSLNQGWYGLENMALIPGTVGAAPIQNIGAYGVELKDHFIALTAWDRVRGELVTLARDDCEFGYRWSRFKGRDAGRYVIWSVRFRLHRQPALKLGYGGVEGYLAGQGVSAPTAQQLFDAICQIRRSKLPDPADLGNVGSFFENPRVSLAQYQALKAEFPALVAFAAGDDAMKLAAGWLIDQAGWKGHRDGAVGVYQHQALVLVNHGGGNREGLLELAARIQRSVQETFGVELEIEPRQYPA